MFQSRLYYVHVFYSVVKLIFVSAIEFIAETKSYQYNEPIYNEVPAIYKQYPPFGEEICSDICFALGKLFASRNR